MIEAAALALALAMGAPDAVSASAETPGWRAQLVWCSAPGQCIRLDDIRGPYTGQDACRARVEEMIRDTLALLGPPVLIRRACLPPDRTKERAA